MRSLIPNIPYVYKPFCPKPKDENEILRAFSSLKDWDILKRMTSKAIKAKFKLVDSISFPVSEMQVDKFTSLLDSQLNQGDKSPLNLSKDLITAHLATEEIELFCFKNSISLSAYFYFWSHIMEARLDAMSKLMGMENKLIEHKVVGYANDGVTSITAIVKLGRNTNLFSTIAHNYIMVKKAIPGLKFKYLSRDNQRMVIENTFKSAIISLKDNLKKLEKHKRVMGIEHSKSNIPLDENLRIDKEIMVQTFLSKRSHTQFQNGRHYLRAFKDTNIILDNSECTPVSEELQKGLVIGYTSKYLSLRIGDKRMVIAELKRNLSVLKKYGNSSKDEIEFTEKLISFVEQKRYANYYPYKAIAKFTGMTKNEVKNLCKKIFMADRNKAIDTSFDDLNLIEV